MRAAAGGLFSLYRPCRLLRGWLADAHERRGARCFKPRVRCGCGRGSPLSLRVKAAPTLPPRRNARMVDAAERVAAARMARIVAAGEHAAPALAPLPLALVLHILSLLPVDCRLLCAGVCRSWRASRVVTDGLLHAAAARAGGQLVALDVDGSERVTFDALLAVVTANGVLRELGTGNIWSPDDERGFLLDTDELEELLRAAPRLVVCEADVECDELAPAHRLLRNEPPFAPLRVHTFEFDGEEADVDEAAVLALAADIASHVHLEWLKLNHTPLSTAAALDAVVDAALMRRLTDVMLHLCDLSPESAPGLVRLVGGGALAELDIFGGRRLQQLLDAAAALALGTALRASGTLTALSLWSVNLWLDPAAATALLLGALTGHLSLRSLDMSYNSVYPASRDEAGAALGALVAANAPALQHAGARAQLPPGRCGAAPAVQRAAGQRAPTCASWTAATTRSRARSCATRCCRRCAPTAACAS